MPIIIGRFQNKTDLVPGPDKFTGIHGNFTEARDQLYFFLPASSVFGCGEIRSLKTTPCKID